MKRKIMDKQIDSKETETKPELYTVLVAGEYYKINGTKGYCLVDVISIICL